MGEMVVTDDRCRLWTARSGTGDPLVCRHGGPGFWDTFGGLAVTALLGHSWSAEVALRFALAHPRAGDPAGLRLRDRDRPAADLARRLRAQPPRPAG